MNKKKIEQSLRFSFLDGIFASGMVGFTQDYFTPFLLLLGAASRDVGILSCLPNFVAALAQLKSPDVAEKVGSRRKIINIFVFLHAAMLLPISFIAWRGGAQPIFFIMLVTLFTSLGAFAVPAWGSLMSDLVAKDKRGEYFGWRNRIFGIIIISATLTAGYILHRMEKVNSYYGFGIIFLTACLFRMISWYFLTRMYEPPQEHKKEDHFTLFMFLRRIKESNFAKFVLFVATLNFSVNLASPFFAVFMLRDLHFNYLLYSFLTIAATLTIYLMMGRWGKHADHVGNLQVLRTTAPIIGTLPLFWIVCREPVFLFFTQVVAGFAWAGFNLCASNFIYDAVTPQKRTRCIAYFNVLNGLALCCGGLLGGFLSERLPPLFGYQLLSLFLVSAVLRLTVGLSFPSMLKEVRSVQKMSSQELFFSVIGVRPFLGIERKSVQYDYETE